MNSQTTIAGTLAEFVATLDYISIPAAVRAQARLHLLDSVGVALASASFDFARTACAGLAALGTGDYTVIGMPARLGLRDAVLMNGLLVHGIEFDDTSLNGRLHPSAFCVPVALGAGGFAKARGQDVLAAYIAGVECAVRLGMAASGGFSPAGFNAVGIIGAFGSALVAGKLLGLDSAQLIMAQGIAYSTAAGNREFSACEPRDKKIAPRDIAAAQFSVYFSAACAAVRRRFTLDELNENTLNDPAIRALAQKVEYAIDPQSNFPAHYSGGVEITTTDGRSFSAREDVNMGSAEKPLAASTIEEKFLNNAGRVFSRERAAEIRDRILDIERCDDIHALATRLGSS